MYGNVYKTSEFIGKMIPKRDESVLINATISFLQFLDQAQDKNPLISLSIHAADGIWFYYKGKQQFFIKPTQKHLMFHLFEDNIVSGLIKKQDSLFKSEWPASYAFKVWKIGVQEIEWLQSFILSIYPKPEITEQTKTEKHSRHIPGDIRQAVLEEFIRSGRICNGVSGVTSKHTVDKSHELEFDHILPHSQGGSNSFYNVQILCKECNRKKSATAK